MSVATGSQNGAGVGAFNNDGGTIARITEFKDLGIKMGTPLFKVRDLIKERQVNIFFSNYKPVCQHLQLGEQTLKAFSPRVEINFIVEALFDLPGFADLETSIALRICVVFACRSTVPTL